MFKSNHIYIAHIRAEGNSKLFNKVYLTRELTQDVYQGKPKKREYPRGQKRYSGKKIFPNLLVTTE